MANSRITVRRATVAKQQYFESIDSLDKNGKVRSILRSPFEYCVFEFFDEYLDKWEFNSDPKIIVERLSNDSVKSKIKTIKAEYEKLLWPLYSQNGPGFKVYEDWFWINSNQYIHLEEKKKKFLFPTEHSPGVYYDNLEITLFLSEPSSASINSIDESFSKWFAWAKEKVSGGKVGATPNFESITYRLELAQKAEDYMAILAVVINANKKNWKVTSYSMKKLN